MKRKNFKNNKSKGGIVDIVVSAGSSLLVMYLGGVAARGFTKIVVETEDWQKGLKPQIKKFYNDVEDFRDNAIDSIKSKLKKLKKEKR